MLSLNRVCLVFCFWAFVGLGCLSSTPNQQLGLKRSNGTRIHHLQDNTSPSSSHSYWRVAAAVGIGAVSLAALNHRFGFWHKVRNHPHVGAFILTAISTLVGFRGFHGGNTCPNTGLPDCHCGH